MARARKLHCACGTPIISANDHGLEFRCDCGATMMIPYEQLTGVEHLARWLDEQAVAKRSHRRSSSARGQTTRERRAPRRP